MNCFNSFNSQLLKKNTEFTKSFLTGIYTNTVDASNNYTITFTDSGTIFLMEDMFCNVVLVGGGGGGGAAGALT